MHSLSSAHSFLGTTSSALESLTYILGTHLLGVHISGLNSLSTYTHLKYPAHLAKLCEPLPQLA
jgi:hypothetical protein